MRITGGRAKGRILMLPKGFHIRPTSVRVREAIFSLIGQDLSGLRVLDLFAGTGVLGLEALSRGAKSVVFVDLSQESMKFIGKNLVLCGFEEIGKLLRHDLGKGLPRRLQRSGKVFDLVFLDPPYGKGRIPPLLEEMESVLSPSSFVLAESHKGESLPTRAGGLRQVDTRTYGDTRITIYRLEVAK